MKFVAIIPSRLESSRLPEKALKPICGIPLIIHVYKRCLLSKNLSEIYVATDSQLIKETVEKYGGKVLLTSKNHPTGTDRIAEACLSVDADVIVNVQGDEALVNPNHIDKACDAMKKDENLNVVILVNKYTVKNNPSSIKVVLNESNNVMYFSRSDIPSNSRSNDDEMLKAYHIIPFKKDFLLKYSNWEPTRLEKIEFNEYLRILEKGYEIKAVEVSSAAISVDTKEDLNIVENQMKTDEFFHLYS